MLLRNWTNVYVFLSVKCWLPFRDNSNPLGESKERSPKISVNCQGPAQEQNVPFLEVEAPFLSGPRLQASCYVLRHGHFWRDARFISSLYKHSVQIGTKRGAQCLPFVSYSAQDLENPKFRNNRSPAGSNVCPLCSGDVERGYCVSF